jgi:hypothetical protein
MLKKTGKYSWRRGMSTLAVEIHPLAQNVEFTVDDLIVSLVDGRKVIVPLVWFPRLSGASKSQLENFEILGDGEGIYWPDIDEDLSVAGLLRGDH